MEIRRHRTEITIETVTMTKIRGSSRSREQIHCPACGEKLSLLEQVGHEGAAELENTRMTRSGEKNEKKIIIYR